MTPREIAPSFRLTTTSAQEPRASSSGLVLPLPPLEESRPRFFAVGTTPNGMGDRHASSSQAKQPEPPTSQSITDAEPIAAMPAPWMPAETPVSRQLADTAAIDHSGTDRVELPKRRLPLLVTLLCLGFGYFLTMSVRSGGGRALVAELGPLLGLFAVPFAIGCLVAVFGAPGRLRSALRGIGAALFVFPFVAMVAVAWHHGAAETVSASSPSHLLQLSEAALVQTTALPVDVAWVWLGALLGLATVGAATCGAAINTARPGNSPRPGV